MACDRGVSQNTDEVSAVRSAAGEAAAAEMRGGGESITIGDSPIGAILAKVIEPLSLWRPLEMS